MRKLFISVCAVLSHLSYAQNPDSLYLISGHPYENTDEMFASVVWKYENDSLKTVAQISDPKFMLESIHYYPDQHAVVAFKTNFPGEYASNNRLVYLNTDDPHKVYDISVGHAGAGNMATHLIDKAHEQFVGLYFYGPQREDAPSCVKVGLADTTPEKMQPEDFAYSVLAGYAGGETDGSSHMLVYSREENGLLEIPYSNKEEQRPAFPYELPEELQFKTHQRHLAVINNEKIFVLDGKNEENKEGLGSTELLIYNKEAGKWSSQYIKGAFSRVRGFRQWIVGYVADYPNGSKLPGADIWQARETGLSPLERFDVYAPGTLFFYNAYTKAYFELETRQADSEILLVCDEQVIYRVYDELYRAPVINGNTLGEPEMLLKSGTVPDIHWAFYSKGGNK